MAEETTEDFYDEWYTSADFDKKYSHTPNANKLVNETVIETNDGRKIEQTYADEAGYTFTIHRKKEGGKITYIAINKPGGNIQTEIKLNNQRLKDLDEASSGMRKRVMKDMPREVIEEGASLAEIYSNFKDYCGGSVPYGERLASEEPQKTAIAINNDPYFADVDYDFDFPSNTRSALTAQRKVAEYNLKTKTETLRTPTPVEDNPQEKIPSQKSTDISKDFAQAYIANKQNTN